MRTLRVMAAIVTVGLLLASGATAQPVTTTMTSVDPSKDFFPPAQGSDGNTGTTWVTIAAFPDYFAVHPPVVLHADLGADTRMNGFSFWNYASVGNRTTTFSLLFATEAEGTGGFGTSIVYNPTFNPVATVGTTVRQDTAFSQLVTARYVEMTMTANNWAGGSGGDRVGFAEFQPNKNPSLNWPLRTASVTSSTAGTDFYPAWQASDGNAATSWVTNARNGGTGDYFSAGPDPVLTIDLDGDLLLEGFAFWNYPGHGNRITEFSLRFATEAEGTGGFGTSITYNPTFLPNAAFNQNTQQNFLFDLPVFARYVELTALDNYFELASGGDRVGFNEIQFSIMPEPGTLSLLALGGIGMLRRRRKNRK